MKKNNQSFVKSCVIYLTIYSIMLFFTFLIMNTIIEHSIKKLTFEIENLDKYQKYLENDEFEKIPIKRYLRNEIVVFDEIGKVIYETYGHKKNKITPQDFEFIEDFSSKIYFAVKKLNDDEDVKYIITKNMQDSKKNNIIIDYAIIDKEYNIIEGKLFKDKKKLTKKQFMILKKEFDDKSSISKYVYTNKNNEKRTILFYQRDLVASEYIKLTRRIKSNWFLLVPIVLIETIFIIYLFYNKIKKSINVTNQKILNPSSNTSIDDIPIEFMEFYVKITNLIDKLEEEKKKRIQEEQVKQSIITNLSHDIKTPLTVIQGYAKAFDDGVVPKEKEKKYIKAIYNKSLQATEIINSLFQYSQMEHCEFKPNFEKCDFTEFCREYLALKYPDIEMLKNKLKVDIEDKEVIYSFDRALITRLFDNIINNSIKHNKKGITIYFNLKIINESIIINIADNGKGLKVDMIDEIFEPFIVDDSARNSGGSGLGLHISKKIVDCHNGKIRVIKNPTKPYKFAIEIIFKVK